MKFLHLSLSTIMVKQRVTDDNFLINLDYFPYLKDFIITLADQRLKGKSLEQINVGKIISNIIMDYKMIYPKQTKKHLF